MRGFTIVELMIVVAIVAILAAIAIPRVARYQYEAKTAELALVLDGLDGQVVSYVFDREAGPDTGATLAQSKTLHDWLCFTGCTTLEGWAPDGQVRCARITGTPTCRETPSRRACATSMATPSA